MLPRLAALAVLACLLPACGFKPEPIGSLPSFPQTAVDGLNRQVAVASAPRRIVSLDPGMTEDLFTLGLGSSVVGRSGGETYPAGVLRPRVVLRQDGTPDMRMLIRLNPDLILAPPTMTGDQARRLALRVGADVYVSGSTSVTGIEHDILQLGLITGDAGRAREVVTGMQQQLVALAKALQGQQPVPVFVDLGYFFTIPSGGLEADMLRLAGAQNVAADANPTGAFPIAQLRATAPQVYLAVAGRGTTLQGLLRSKATRNLPAIRDRRFRLIPDNLLTDHGPKVIDHLTELARAVHPTLVLSPQ
ncbi:MAG: ABC transporter substrate-binding protein [Gaiellales bacterium]